MSEPNASLLAAHLAVHTWLEDRTYAVLEALVALDVGRAAASLAQLARALDAHMAFEDKEILPVYAKVAPADGPGRADHVAGDHVILVRHVGALRDALVELANLAVPDAPDVHARRPDLRDVLERLPPFYRFLGTLEHHTAREQASVYPGFARAVDDAARERATRALLDLVATAW